MLPEAQKERKKKKKKKISFQMPLEAKLFQIPIDLRSKKILAYKCSQKQKTNKDFSFQMPLVAEIFQITNALRSKNKQLPNALWL